MALLTAVAKGFSRRALPVALTGLRSATSSRLPDLQPLTQAHRQAYVPYVSAFFAGNNSGRGFAAAAGLSQETIDICKSTAPVLAEHGYSITKTMYSKMLADHPDVSELFNKTHQQEINGQKAFQPQALASAVHAYASHMDDLGALTTAVERIAHKHVSVMVTPEQYDIVGANLLWAIKEVLGDAATPQVISAWGEAYGFLANVFINREKQLYDEFAASPNGWRGWKEFEVVRKEIEVYSIMSVYLRPKDGKGVPSYLPGQYIGLRANVPGEGIVVRNYSLSSAPASDVFRITVKRDRPKGKMAPYGVMSYYIHDRLDIGDTIEVSQPAGDFWFQEDGSSKPLVLIAGGIGITPVISILEHIVQNKIPRHVTVFASVRSSKLEPYSEALKEIAVSNLNVDLNLVYDDPPQAWNTKGPLTIDHVKTGLTTKDSEYYFCGPSGFMSGLASGLKEWGVPQEQLHYEYFGPYEQ